ncbi:MAG: hypothetical protein GX245_06435 [Eubacteriaceae bacterium]|jgi:hypothetical protein|nr:hypothetical protein [Eubacteriaceae bacterium]
MKCPFCTKDIFPGMNFCPHCGKHISQDPAAENSATHLAEPATQPISPSSVRQEVAVPSPSANSFTSPPDVGGNMPVKKTNLKLVLIISAIAVLLAGAVLAYFLLLSPKADVTQTTKTIEAGTEVDPLTLIAVKDAENFNVTVKSSDLDTNKLGDYNIIYTVTSKEHNKGKDYEFTFTVQDTTPPQITGESTFTVLKGEQLDVRSAMTITDNLDGIIDPSAATVNGTPDFAKAGTYPITLSVSDKSGNTATKEVSIVVEDKSNPETFFNQINTAWGYVNFPDQMMIIKKVNNKYMMYSGQKNNQGFGGEFTFQSIAPDGRTAVLEWRYNYEMGTQIMTVKVDLGAPGDGKMRMDIGGSGWEDMFLHKGSEKLDTP